MTGRSKGRALAYLRRSTDRQEISLSAQLDWARGQAAVHGVELDASPADLAHLRDKGFSSYKGLRVDDGISGADMNRPGFLALIGDAQRDPTISHVLSYRRDRFARPEDAIPMVAIEKRLRLAGVTIVFAEGVAGPLIRGQDDIAADIAMLFGYSESGEFLRKHAERVLQAQCQLASGGYRTGGNAPYGFGRALVDAAGQVVQELSPGTTARRPGCHVRLIAKDRDKIGVWLLILELRERGWGYKRIAQHLNALGIPSPGAGSTRTDQGIKHVVSGRWNVNTLKELCNNRAILGIQDYGRRSEGAHRRLGIAGPRLLGGEDRDAADRPKVVMNDPSVRIAAPLGIEPLYESDRWERLQEMSARRGSSQRGVPRAKDPSRYPLSTRLVDMTGGCGSILYGLTNGGRPLYKCGLYMRTAGAECESNAVDGEAMLRFTLKTLAELVDRQGHRDRLRELVAERARRDRVEPDKGPGPEESTAVARLAALRGDLERTRRRLASETDDVLYKALRIEYKRLDAEIDEAEKAVQSARRTRPAAPAKPIEEEVDAAMGLMDDIGRVASDESARAEVRGLLAVLGLRIGLTFGDAVKGRKRKVRRLLGGVMVFGDTALPVPIHGAANRAAWVGGSGDGPLAASRDPAEDHDSGEECQPAPTVACVVDGCGGREIEVLSSDGDRVPVGKLTRQAGLRREGTSFTKESRGESFRPLIIGRISSSAI